MSALEGLEKPREMGLSDIYPPPQQLETLGAVTLPPFDPLRLLPPKLSKWVLDVARCTSTPVEMAAVACMVTIAGVLGRKVLVQPYDDNPTWTEALNLWGLVVMPPSSLKTPVLKAATEPLEQIQAQLHAQHKEAMAVYEQALQDWDAQPKDKKEQRPEHPLERAALVMDITRERLASLLSMNPNGLIAVLDEVLGLFKQWERPDKKADRLFYLQTWSGQGAMSVQRSSRPSEWIEGLCLSLIGNATPGPLAAYISEAARGGTGEDGLLPRIQLMVTPEMPAFDRTRHVPDLNTRRAYIGLVRGLYDATPQTLGARADDEGRWILHLTPEASGFFHEWRSQLEDRVRSKNTPDVEKALLGKYRGLVPRLAALLHLSSELTGPIEKVEVVRALAWVSILEQHAKKVYGAVLAREQTAAHALADRIRGKAKPLEGNFTAREVGRAGWREIPNAEAARAAIGELLELGWILAVQDDKARTEKFSVNPRVYSEGS